VLVTTNEGKRITSLIGEEMLYPCFIFAHNRRDNNTFNRGSVIYRLDGEINLETLRNALIRTIEMKESLRSSRGSSSTNADLISQQKEEIAQLEKLEEERKKKEREDKIRLEREIEEKKKKAEEMEQLKLKKIKSLPPEPESENPESSLIIFRYPDGNRRIERRFLKSEKVNVNYI
jgi:hypothetical protein